MGGSAFAGTDFWAVVGESTIDQICNYIGRI